MKKALKIIQILKKTYPDAKCALDFKNPEQLLVATILSAQCTDKRVNLVTPALFKRCQKSKDFAEISQKELETYIRYTGFYSNKAKSIRGAFQMICEKHGGQVPKTMEELVKLPGVGRKTANVILGNAYDIPGLTVDTHMLRVNKRLGLSLEKDAVKMERELMKIVPKKDWTLYSHLVIHHGRAICNARKPLCSKCPLEKLCPKNGVQKYG